MNVGSDEVFLANTILMTPLVYNKIASQPFAGNNGTATETVLSFFLRTRAATNPGLQVISYPYLKILDTSTDTNILVYKKDPMILNQEIPQPMETFGPFTNDSGQKFRVDVRMRHAGIQLRYPVAAKKGVVKKA